MPCCQHKQPDHELPPCAAAKGIKDFVVEAVKNSGDKIVEMVKEELVQQELKNRAGLVLKALGEKDRLERAIQGVCPEHKGFDATGKLHHTYYSERQVEEIKRQKDRLGEVVAVLEEALTNANYEPLKELAKQW